MNGNNTPGFTIIALYKVQCYFVGYNRPEILKAQINF